MAACHAHWQFTITGITINRIRNGKIVEEWQEWDTYGLMRQLGVLPTLQHETAAA
jgi:predicted ester cyclase